MAAVLRARAMSQSEPRGDIEREGHVVRDG